MIMEKDKLRSKVFFKCFSNEMEKWKKIYLEFNENKIRAYI